MYAFKEIEFSCNKAIEQKATRHFDVLFHYFHFITSSLISQGGGEGINSAETESRICRKYEIYNVKCR